MVKVYPMFVTAYFGRSTLGAVLASLPGEMDLQSSSFPLWSRSTWGYGTSRARRV
jgi:hypothetical protein